MSKGKQHNGFDLSDFFYPNPNLIHCHKRLRAGEIHFYNCLLAERRDNVPVHIQNFLFLFFGLVPSGPRSKEKASTKKLPIVPAPWFYDIL